MARIDEVLSGEKSWGAWCLDQLAHVGLGAAYALPIEGAALFLLDWSIPATLIAGAVIALFGGVLREIVHAAKTGKAHPLDRSVDALFHLPGAGVALGILLLIRVLT
jgi:hypothetical protein